MADAIPLEEAIERFGVEATALCSCGHPLISHMPPVYECRGMAGWVDDEGIHSRRCACSQFDPAGR